MFIIVIVLFIWIAKVSNRLSAVEKKLVQNHGAFPMAAPLSQLAPKPPTAEEYSSVLQKAPETRVEHIASNSALPVDERINSAQPHRTDSEVEAIFATSWLNKIGIVALLLGMVLFFKYAIDQGWITPWLRVIIGFLVGGLLVYLGHLWKEKFGTRAHGLSGGGIALLYFTIFAAYQFYGLMPQPVAFILILGVAALSVWLSFMYSSLTLGILGFFGAFGAPIMLSSGKNQQAQLFVYLTILNVTTIIIIARKYWLELIALALLGTAIDFSWWGNSFSNANNTFASLFFVVLTTTLYVVGIGMLTRYHTRKNTLPASFEKNVSVVSVGAGLFYFIAVLLLLNDSYHSMLAPVSLLSAVMFLFTYALVDRLEFEMLNYSLSIVGAILLVCAAGWQWHTNVLALAWLALGLFGLTIGALVKREELRTWGIIILFLALFKSFVEPYAGSSEVFLFNAKFSLMFASTLSLLYAGWLYDHYPPKKADNNIRSLLEVVAAVALWVAVSWDLTSAITGRSQLWHSQWINFWWILYPTLLSFIAFTSKRKMLMSVAAVLLGLSFIRVLWLSYGVNPAFLINAKFGLMFAETVALLFVAGLHKRQEGQNQLSDVLRVAASLLFWFAVSWEIVEYFRYADSNNARNLLLSLWWIVYAVGLLVAGSVGASVIFRKVSIVLFALAILKVFLYDVQALDTPYRIAAFIILGVILLIVSFSYQRNRDRIVKFLENEVIKN